MRENVFTGINIQYPISELILSGQKKIETRTYPIPEKFINVPMLLIETPGKKGNFEARIRGIIVFGPSFKYENRRDFYADTKRHCVTANSPWKWNKKKKFGWVIKLVEKINPPLPAPKNKGIVYTNAISLRIKSSCL